MPNILKIFFTALLLITISGTAKAELNIDITQGNVDPLPVALTNLNGTTSEAGNTGKDIINVVAADLERSGLFRAIDQRAFIEKIASGKNLPHFPSWRQINAAGLLTGDIKINDNGTMDIEFRLWDVFSERQLTGKAYSTDKKHWRRVAHLIADKIYERLTGEKGYFDTRIVYVAESGPGTKRVKRLAIMDQDGANHQFLTDGKDLVLTPRFSHNSQKIIYMSYAGKKPRVYIRDLEAGTEKLLGHFEGISFAPRFSPKGDRALLSASINANSEIFVLDLNSGNQTRLTNNPAIDTSPSFSPNEEFITFNSDRGGSQQLYVMRADGSDVRRISFAEGRYGTPVWSPRGDLIAFTKMYKGKFYIGVMRPDGTSERLLTESYLDEGPTWSPNGRVIMFTRQERSYSSTKPGASHIYSVDLTGYNERQILTPLDASDPSWSPLLQ